MINLSIKKFLILCIGSIIMGIGVVLATVTALGADTVAFLWNGIHIKFHISLGVANYLFTSFFLILVLFVDKKQIGLGTIFSPLIQGIAMDIIILIIPPINSFVVRVIVMIIGIVLIAVGGGITSAADIGKSPYVGFTFALKNKYNCSLTISRIVLDGLCLLLGILLGAQLNIGPIVSVFLMGPITEASCQKVRNTYFFV